MGADGKEGDEDFTKVGIAEGTIGVKLLNLSRLCMMRSDGSFIWVLCCAREATTKSINTHRYRRTRNIFEGFSS